MRLCITYQPPLVPYINSLQYRQKNLNIIFKKKQKFIKFLNKTSYKNFKDIVRSYVTENKNQPLPYLFIVHVVCSIQQYIDATTFTNLTHILLEIIRKTSQPRTSLTKADTCPMT